MKIFIVFALVLFVVSCDESPKVMPSAANAPLSSANTTADKPSQISYNTSMNFSASGMLRAILHAGRVQTYETKHYTWMDSSVHVDFYNGLGIHSSTLTSQSAKVNSTTNDMTAYGHVHIVSDSGTTVDTDSLEWNNKSQLIHSDAPVHIVEKNGRITDGIGFESDQNLEHYHIMRPTILTPTESFQTHSNQNTLKPETPQIPGAGAMQAEPLKPMLVPRDTTRAK